jgi:hypothetical protein
MEAKSQLLTVHIWATLANLGIGTALALHWIPSVGASYGGALSAMMILTVIAVFSAARSSTPPK